jgi:hypothetical protein
METYFWSFVVALFVFFLGVTNPRRCAGQKGKELSLESGAIMGVTMRAGK